MPTFKARFTFRNVSPLYLITGLPYKILLPPDFHSILFPNTPEHLALLLRNARFKLDRLSSNFLPADQHYYLLF